MSFSEENPHFGPNIGDIDEYKRSEGVRRSLASTFDDYAPTESVVLYSQDAHGPLTEIVLGGLVPTTSNSTTYVDITLVKRVVHGRETTSLVVKDEKYEISEDGVKLSAIPNRRLNDTELEKVKFWLGRKPTVAIWSIDYSAPLAEKWRTSQQEITETTN